MITATARANVIVAVRERVNAHVSKRLNERESLQLALASALREPEDIVGFLVPLHVAKIALRNCEKVRLRADEWTALFGNGCVPLRGDAVDGIANSSEFAHQAVRVQNALRMTITERQQAAIWARPWSKLLLYVAMHLNDADDALTGVLGTIIKADGRRIEEMQQEIDDSGLETMLLSKSIVSLTQSVI